MRPLLRAALQLGFISVVILFLVLATTLRGQTAVDLTQAKALLRQNDLAAAETALRGAAAANPTSSEPLYLLGLTLHRENKPKDSLAAYTQAAALATPHSEDLRIVALDYVLLNAYPDAIHWLERSVAADPRNTEAWYDLGRAHMNQGNFIEAERDFNHTLALSPRHAKALDNLGLSLEAQNRTDEALAAYTRAIALQTSSPQRSEQPFLNLGTLLNAKTRSAEAVPPLQQSIAITPGCPRCHEELARAYTATGQSAAALKEMEEAVSLDPQNPRFHYQLGQLYRHAGSPERAEAELRKSASLYGSHSTNPER